MSLNNREWATLFWLLAAFTWALTHPRIRSSLRTVGRTLLSPKLLVPLLSMLLYVALVLGLGRWIGLWNWSLITASVTWFLGAGFVLFLNLDKASREEMFFRRVALRTLEVTVFVEFFMNLFVLSLPAELLLQPLLVLLVLLSLVAERELKYHSVKRFVDTLSALIGLALAAFILVQLFRQWDELDKGARLLEFALPVWLTVALLPFVYLVSLYMSYEVAFLRIDWIAKERSRRWRAKLALVTVLRGRTRSVAAFAGHWAEEAASAGSFRAAREKIKGFGTSRRQLEAAVKEERARRERYAGVAGTDSEGRQLDRREFEETTEALRWLATCQMGWYRNHGGRYRANMLEILNNDFRSQGLPPEHGITIHVARDGQSWWAWRRTITGWCFAIGSAGPPPEQWEFDGSEPPDGFPGEDEKWGVGPFNSESNSNL